MSTLRVLALLMASSACAPAPDASLSSAAGVVPLPCASFPAPGDVPVRITSGGVERSMIVHVPASYDGKKPLPLVLVLHGFGGRAAPMANLTQMSCKAEAEGFLVAYLNGTPCDPDFDDLGDDEGCTGAQQGWNSGLTPSLGITVDDVRFVRDLLGVLAARWRIDARRVYAAGLSNGGMMTHRLAAELPDVLAGAAVVAGLMGRDPEGDGSYLMIPDAAGSIPMLIMHGTSDRSIAYDGMTTDGVVTFLCPCKSVAEAVAYWLEQNHCRGPVCSGTEGDVTTTTYGGCAGNNDVVLITIEGGPHGWPAGATDAIWDFFAAHPLTADP